jgi:hypothetical protein
MYLNEHIFIIQCMLVEIMIAQESDANSTYCEFFRTSTFSVVSLQIWVSGKSCMEV